MRTLLKRRAISRGILVIGAVSAMVLASLASTESPAGAPDATGPPAARAASPGEPVLASGSSAILDFPFVDLEGKSHVLSETRGHPTLLEFWASWCVPCRKGFPFLDALQEEHRPAGLHVVAVTLEEDDAAVRDFVARHGGGFQVGRDPSGRAGEIAGVEAMPTALLLDGDGRVLARFEGGTDAVHRRIETAIGAVMRGEPLAPELATGAAGATAPDKSGLRAWQRGYLADPIMNLDGDVLTRSIREHVHASKEGAAGDGGVAGGGCGCN